MFNAQFSMFNAHQFQTHDYGLSLVPRRGIHKDWIVCSCNPSNHFNLTPNPSPSERGITAPLCSNQFQYLICNSFIGIGLTPNPSPSERGRLYLFTQINFNISSAILSSASASPL